METDQIEYDVPAKSSKKVLYLMALLLTGLIVIVGILFYFWMNESKEVDRLQESLATSNQKIEALSRSVGDNGAINDGSSSASDVLDQAVVSDSDNNAIIKMTSAQAHARVDSETAKLTIVIAKKELPFARVSVSTEEAGGYTCVLKKVDDVWVVLFCGQSPPLQEELDQWGVPDSMIQS